MRERLVSFPTHIVHPRLSVSTPPLTQLSAPVYPLSSASCILWKNQIPNNILHCAYIIHPLILEENVELERYALFKINFHISAGLRDVACVSIRITPLIHLHTITQKLRQTKILEFIDRQFSLLYVTITYL